MSSTPWDDTLHSRPFPIFSRSWGARWEWYVKTLLKLREYLDLGRVVMRGGMMCHCGLGNPDLVIVIVDIGIGIGCSCSAEVDFS